MWLQVCLWRRTHTHYIHLRSLHLHLCGCDIITFNTRSILDTWWYKQHAILVIIFFPDLFGWKREFINRWQLMWRCCSRWSRRGHFNCEFFHDIETYPNITYHFCNSSQSLNATDDLWAQLFGGWTQSLQAYALEAPNISISQDQSRSLETSENTSASRAQGFPLTLDLRPMLTRCCCYVWRITDQMSDNYKWYEATSRNAMRQWPTSDLGNVEWLGGLTWVCPSPSHLPLQHSELICVKNLDSFDLRPSELLSWASSSSNPQEPRASASPTLLYVL